MAHIQAVLTPCFMASRLVSCPNVQHHLSLLPPPPLQVHCHVTHLLVNGRMTPTVRLWDNRWGGGGRLTTPLPLSLPLYNGSKQTIHPQSNTTPPSTTPPPLPHAPTPNPLLVHNTIGQYPRTHAPHPPPQPTPKPQTPNPNTRPNPL